MIIWEQKSYSDRREAAGVMPSRLHLPRSLYDFSVRDFPTIFLKIECDHGLRRRCLQFIRASFDFVLAFFDVLSRNCLEIVGKSKGLRTL